MLITIMSKAFALKNVTPFKNSKIFKTSAELCVRVMQKAIHVRMENL